MHDITQVIGGGYCVGCGACVTQASNYIVIAENECQQYQAKILDGVNSKALSVASSVCPFSNIGLNENELSDLFFEKSTGSEDDIIGYYQSLYAGHVTDNDFRGKTTSGGIISWTLNQLLKLSMVDAVIHVHKSAKEKTLFEYGISFTSDKVMSGAKSRYYPVEMSKVIDFVCNNEGRYAFVGLPCYVKALRKLSISNPTIKERVKYCIGLVCGHLKSKAFADLIGWEAGIVPGKLVDIDFRYKLTNRPADNYGIRVVDDTGKSTVLIARETFGTNWGHGFFKYKSCDYCDDIFSETADLSVGDAWMKPYTEDSKGNSLIVVRNAQIEKLIKAGIKTEELNLNILTPDEMRKAQGGGFRHRRIALGYRLYIKQKNNEWVPRKRVQANRNSISTSRKLVDIFRIYLREKSAEYWKQCHLSGNYSNFQHQMYMPSKAYDILLKIAAFGKRLKG